RENTILRRRLCGRASVLTAIASFACACAADKHAVAPATSAGAAVAIREGKDTAPPPIPMGEPATIARILDEGEHRNQVMNHLGYLTQRIGPRLTGSSNAEKACLWTLDKFRSWGLDAHLYEWGTASTRFDRGPCTGKL